MFNKLNNPYLTIITIILFVILATYSHLYVRPAVYTLDERTQLTNLIEHLNAPDQTASNETKIVYLYGEE